jgi:hypothetical protein
MYFTLLSRDNHLGHGTVFSVRIERTDLFRDQGARVKMAPELPEAFYVAFEFCRRVSLIESWFALFPTDVAASKMPQL